MSRSDYEHWNEERDIVWWNEEGKHANEDPHDDDDLGYYGPDKEATDEEIERSFDAYR